MKRWTLFAVGVILLVSTSMLVFDIDVLPSDSLTIRIIPIAYGMPSPEDTALAQAGKLKLAGCLVPKIRPRWALVFSTPWRSPK